MSSLSSFGLLGAAGSLACEVPVAMWSPGVDAVGSWLDQYGGVTANVDWSMYTALPVPAEPRARVGYCYAPLLDTAVMGSSIRAFGAFPSLATLLNAPLDYFDVERMAMGVDLGRRRVMHVVETGMYEFGRLAVTAMSGTSFQVEPGSLAEYLLNVYAAIPRLKLDTGWCVGAASAEVASLLAKLSELSGVPVGSFDVSDAAVAVRTAAFQTVEQKALFRVLEAIGDNVLSLMLSMRVLARGYAVQHYQDARNALSNNVYLAGIADRVGLLEHVLFMPGVSHLGKVGAGCFEVAVAMVYRAGGMDAVVKFSEKVMLFAGYPSLE